MRNSLENRRVTIALTDDYFDQTYIEITDACTLNCPYCFNSSRRENNVFMKKEQVYRYAQAIHGSRKVPLIYLSGGEPCLHPDLADIVYKLQEENYKVIILTNGTVSDTDFLQTFPRDTCWQIGNAFVSSPQMYSKNMTKHISNVTRIATTFSETIHTLAYTITSQNYIFAEEYIRTFLKYPNVKFLLSFVQKRGRACDNWSMFSVPTSIKLLTIQHLSTISKRVQFCGVTLDHDLSSFFKLKKGNVYLCCKNKELYINSSGTPHFCEKIDVLLKCPLYIEQKIDVEHKSSIVIPKDCATTKCDLYLSCASMCLQRIKEEERLCQI